MQLHIHSCILVFTSIPQAQSLGLTMERSNVNALVIVIGVAHWWCWRIILAEELVGGNEWKHNIANDSNKCDSYWCCGLVTKWTKVPTSWTPGCWRVSLLSQVQHLHWQSSGSQDYVCKQLGTYIEAYLALEVVLLMIFCCMIHELENLSLHLL